jgi:CRP/FNR family cyclic AMP-dependent transcriptional regulator
MNSLEVLALLRLHPVMRHWEHASVDEWAEVLATFSLFSEVGKRKLRKLVRSARFAEVAAGGTVISNGDSSDSLYVILDGAAKELRRPAPRELGVGDYFGELALIDGAPRSATVVATQNLHVMRLPAQSVLALARQHPAITVTMLKDLSRRLRRLEAQTAR